VVLGQGWNSKNIVRSLFLAHFKSFMNKQSWILFVCLLNRYKFKERLKYLIRRKKSHRANRAPTSMFLQIVFISRYSAMFLNSLDKNIDKKVKWKVGLTKPGWKSYIFISVN
jgi:hypothetical protein